MRLKIKYLFFFLFSCGILNAQPPVVKEQWLAPACLPKLFGLQDASGVTVLDAKYDFLKEQEEDAWIALSGLNYGVIDHKGNWLIKPEFISIYQYSKGKAVAGKKVPAPVSNRYEYSYNRKDSVIQYGVVDESGVWLIEAKYDLLQLCDDGSVLYKDELDKYGFLNLDGSILIGARYEYCTRMSNGSAVIGERKHGKEDVYDVYNRRNEFKSGNYFLIDKSGSKLNAEPYDLIREFSEGRAAFNKGGLWKKSRYGGSERMLGGKWGFLDASGKEVVSPIYDYVYDYQNTKEGIKAKVRVGTKVFWIDANGVEVAPASTDGAELYQVFCNAGSFGYIDKKGEWVIQPQYYVANEFSEGLASVMVLRASDLDCNKPEGYEDDNSYLIDYGYQSTNSRSTLNFFNVGLHRRYDDAESDLTRDDSLRMVEQNKRRLYGYIDVTGTTILPAKYEVALAFHDNRAYVKFRGAWGVIDRQGNWIMPPVLETPESMTYAAAGNENYYGYNSRNKVDVTSEVAETNAGSEIYRFSEGMGMIYKYDKYGFMDTTGKIVVAPVYDEVRTFEFGFAAVRHQDKWGFIDKTGKEVIPIRFQYASSFSKEGMALAAVYPNEADLGPPKAGMEYQESEEIFYGYLDRNGKWLIKPQYYSASPFSEGLAVAALDYGNYGYIDKTGKFVIPPKYNYVEDFNNGFAYVRVRMYDAVYIDKKGVQSKKYSIKNPPPRINDELRLDIDVNGKYGYVDQNGNEVISHLFTHLGTFQQVK